MNRAAFHVAAVFLAAAAAAFAEQGAAVASIRWNSALHEFPTLGYREPVDLERSTLPVDRALRLKAGTTYNCHYYTKTHIEGAESFERSVDAGGQETLTDLYLLQHGYRRASGLATAVGDVVTALRPPTAFGESTYLSHSGVVVEVGPGGEIRKIRQKFSPTEPVVDLTLEDFVSAYSGKYPWQCVVWTRATDVSSNR